MLLEPFLRGAVVGLSIAAPVGPIGVLCIRRALSGGWKLGLATGLGAAVADALYGCVAALGLDTVTRFLTAGAVYLGVGGGLFLCWMGIQTWRSRPLAGPGESTASVDLVQALGSTVFLTLANPATLLSFTAIFAGFGVGSSLPRTAIPDWIAGVFSGSATWWLMLSGGVASLRHRFNPGWLRIVNLISGTVLIGFGLGALARALRTLLS